MSAVNEKKGIPSDEATNMAGQQTLCNPTGNLQFVGPTPPVGFIAPAPATPQQPAIFVQVNQRKSKKKPNYNHKLAKILAIVQLVNGGLAIILNILGIVVSATAEYQYTEDDEDSGGAYYFDPTYPYYVACGIWCPAIFLSLSGAFGLAAAYKKTRGLIVTNLVLSCVSSVFVGVMTGFSGWAFGTDVNRLVKGFSYEAWVPVKPVTWPDFNSNTYQYGTTVGYPYYHYNYYHSYGYGYGHRQYETRNADAALTPSAQSMAVSVFCVLVSLVELVACIWSAVLCCKVMCCGTRKNYEGSASVQYASNPDTVRSQLLVLDSQGRPIQGAQVVQMPGPSQVQAPQTNPGVYPQMLASGVQTGENDQSKESMFLPPPYQE